MIFKKKLKRTEVMVDRHFHGRNGDLENWSRTTREYEGDKLISEVFEEQNSTEADEKTSTPGYSISK